MKKNSSIIVGTLVIIVGLIFLGNNLELWNCNLFFDGWWTLFILVPSFFGLFQKDSWRGAILGLCIGGLLLLAAQDIIAWNMVGKIFIPLAIIYVGLAIVFKPSHVNHHISDGKINDAKEYISIFGSSKDKKTDELTDLQITTVFGGVELDLRDSKLKNDVTLECVAIFGGIDLIVPDNVVVKYTGVPIFGGIENKNVAREEGKITITVNYVCVFGGIDIK